MFNDAQQRAIITPGNCLITACPGSGKTTVLQHRAKHKLTQNPKGRVLGVTFTAEAAAELRNRILKEVPNARDRVRCGTFHSLCKMQLEQSGKRVKLINEVQQTELIRRAYKDAGDADVTFEAASRFIESTKAAVDPILPKDDPLVRVYEAYQLLLQQIGAYDFADLLVLATRGMQNGEIRAFDVNYILADEYQDSDQVQCAWLIEHVRRGIEVCVVGDDDQSVYAWRNAQGVKGMREFSRVAGATHISLDMTYRCAQEIMVPSALLITKNKERIEKQLMTANRERGEARVLRFESRAKEFEAVARAIALSGCPENWGVLARTNSLLEHLEECISPYVPVSRSGGVSFWDVRGPALFLSLCRSLVYGEMLGVDEVLRRSGVTEAQLADVHQRYRSNEPGGLARFLADTRGTGKDPVSRFRLSLQSWARMLPKGPEQTTLVLKGIAKYLQNYVTLYDSKRKEEDRIRDMARLDNCARSLSNIGGPLERRLRILSDEKDEIKKDSARLMTLHSSKGLEFPHVWIIACEEGVIPSPSSVDEDEERRLLYVGMTRAKYDLTISYVISENNPPSRFIRETGLH